MFLSKFNALLKEKGSISLYAMIALGLFTGLSGTLIIAIINRVMQLDPQNKTFYPNLFVGFIAVLGVHFSVQIFYQSSLIKLSHAMIWKIRMMTLDNVRQADFVKYLLFGSNKVHAILTRDAFELSQFSQMLSTIIISAVTVVSGFAYLLWITPLGSLITLFLALMVVAIQFVTRKKIDRKVNEARKIEEQYNKYFLCVLDGVKELKLDQKKSNDLFDNYVVKTGSKAQKMWANVSIRFYINGVMGTIFFYVIIMLFLFIFPYFNKSLLPNSFEYILIVLYLMGPAQVIINSIPNFSFASKALDRFNELKQLEEEKEVNATAPAPEALQPSTISFHDLVFQYESEEDERKFHIGPLNFGLSKGEVTFLSGGNGSGKSTFIRLLTGLYTAKSGHIKLDDSTVSITQADPYRSLFSVVYTDNYVFDTVLGYAVNQDQKMNEILKELGLSSKVTCTGHVFSTVDLSYGQKKRLSLAISLLENKPIYVFDEICANQDAEFKEYFYKTILKRLRESDKIVLVVTHDEKYFNIADKHYKMESGNVFLNRVAEMT